MVGGNAPGLVAREPIGCRAASRLVLEMKVGGCLSDALAVPIPPMARLKQKKTIGAHIAPARALAPTGKCKRVIFAFVVDT
jgi:hypothetical protein